ncbi:MAG: helix-turn-helix domain-containing protein, partial [Bacteroidota bacterium]
RDKVAEKLAISSSYLTVVIKEETGKSFTAFINQYRVRDVERMLHDNTFDNFDVLSIGLEAGFKSKSAYYSTFKNLTGITPAQFKKKS